jgi:hypothetical protein
MWRMFQKRYFSAYRFQGILIVQSRGYVVIPARRHCNMHQRCFTGTQISLCVSACIVWHLHQSVLIYLTVGTSLENMMLYNISQSTSLATHQLAPRSRKRESLSSWSSAGLVKHRDNFCLYTVQIIAKCNLANHLATP